MRRDDHDRIYRSLRNYEDVERVSEKENIDYEIVFVIYTQKTVRRATRGYYRVKHAAKPLLKQWRNGSSFIDLARKEDFPPMLMAFLLVQEMGHSKKAFWSYVREEKRAPTKRLAKELMDARNVDKIYSPEANLQQDERGRLGEERLAQWLDSKGICYHTENDLREKGHVKTPDFLLAEPVKIDGYIYNWFESKAIFADDLEYKRHLKSQLRPYRELHGQGAVAYWLGYLDDLPIEEGIKLLKPDFFDGF